MSTSTLEGEIIFILRTLRSMISDGRSNSSTMHRGMAPPQGLALSNLRSMMYVSMFGSLAQTSAAHAPLGPPPITATRYFISTFAAAVRGAASGSEFLCATRAAAGAARRASFTMVAESLWAARGRIAANTSSCL